jgi:hypothetical protein
MPRHNPERRAWRGRSYRKGGEQVRNLKDIAHAKDHTMASIPVSSTIVKLHLKRVTSEVFTGETALGIYALEPSVTKPGTVEVIYTPTGGGPLLHWNFTSLKVAKKAVSLHAAQEGFKARNTRLANEAAGVTP